MVKGQEVAYSLSAGITTSGFLGVFVPVEYSDTNEQFISEILTFKRSLEFDENLEPILVPVLPTGIVEAVDGVTVVVQPTPTPNFSILYDDNVATSPFQQNIAGLILIGVGVVATIFLVLWRRPAKKEK